VNNQPSSFALTLDPRSVLSIPFILYNIITVLFTAVVVVYTARRGEVNAGLRISAPNNEYVLIIMSDDNRV
jgi:hypothetical protein